MSVKRNTLLQFSAAFEQNVSLNRNILCERSKSEMDMTRRQFATGSCS